MTTTWTILRTTWCWPAVEPDMSAGIGRLQIQPTGRTFPTFRSAAWDAAVMQQANVGRHYWAAPLEAA